MCVSDGFMLIGTHDDMDCSRQCCEQLRTLSLCTVKNSPPGCLPSLPSPGLSFALIGRAYPLFERHHTTILVVLDELRISRAQLNIVKSSSSRRSSRSSRWTRFQDSQNRRRLMSSSPWEFAGSFSGAGGGQKVSRHLVPSSRVPSTPPGPLPGYMLCPGG